ISLKSRRRMNLWVHAIALTQRRYDATRGGDLRNLIPFISRFCSCGGIPEKQVPENDLTAGGHKDRKPRQILIRFDCLESLHFAEVIKKHHGMDGNSQASNDYEDHPANSQVLGIVILGIVEHLQQDANEACAESRNREGCYHSENDGPFGCRFHESTFALSQPSLQDLVWEGREWYGGIVPTVKTVG
ncbi:MAG: hypothetical protein WCI73_18095, partial [Phycisphaerae bacterium]